MIPGIWRFFTAAIYAAAAAPVGFAMAYIALVIARNWVGLGVLVDADPASLALVPVAGALFAALGAAFGYLCSLPA